jgi:hypothetical protein
MIAWVQEIMIRAVDRTNASLIDTDPTVANTRRKYFEPGGPTQRISDSFTLTGRSEDILGIVFMAPTVARSAHRTAMSIRDYKIGTDRVSHWTDGLRCMAKMDH